MHLQSTVIAPCLIAALSTCTPLQPESSDDSARREPAPAGVAEPMAAAERTGPGELGEVVQELGERLWIVFQDRTHTHWFGSDGEGVYRVRGKDIVRYTTKDGLCNDHIRQIVEDESGNLYFNTCGGISRFDGQRFSTLVPIRSRTSASEWKSEPSDLWFKGRQEDNGPYRYDGQSLYQLEFPKHVLEDEFNSKFPGVPYSPYCIYTIHKDRRGSLWFGTSTFGVCRYDGESFTWISEPELTELDNGPSFGVRGILEDQDGKFWFNDLRHCYDAYPTHADQPETAAPKYRKERGLVDAGELSATDPTSFTSALRDSQGASWMATYGAGVWQYDGQRLTHYPVQESGKMVLLFSIYEDREGVLWLGTCEGGAYRFNGKAFERFT